MFKFRSKTTVKKTVGKGVVGLTADPKKAKRQHKNPMGWTEEGPFISVKAAREWKQYYVSQGYATATEESGWRYGYRYPIAESLEE